MPPEAYKAAEIPGAQSPFPPISMGRADDTWQAMLGLLDEMAASLRGSHKAVLASDGLGLENCTREQARLHRALEMLLWPLAWPGTAVQRDVQKDDPKDLQNNAQKKDDLKNARPAGPQFVPRFATRPVPPSVPHCAPSLAAELLAAEWRVLHATRVQAALLRRARQFQRILSNLAAAQGSPCGAWFGQSPQF
jgi:hypothetical protein